MRELREYRSMNEFMTKGSFKNNFETQCENHCFYKQNLLTKFAKET